MSMFGEILNAVFSPSDGTIKTTLSGYSGGSGFTSASVSSVNDTATSTTLVNANSLAKERVIQNDSSSALYVKFGATASATDYTAKLYTDDILTTQYNGRIDGIWASDSTGAAKVTEIS